MLTTISITMIIIVLVILFVLFFIATYKVVDPNVAHVVVFMSRGRKIYAPKLTADAKAKTAYFYIPLLMKRFIMPLTNVKMDIPDIHLNDIQVAPFVCDVITWIHIDDPIKAAERLDLSTKDTFSSLREDLINIVQAVARAVAMKQEVLDIMRDRKTFALSVSAEVDGVLGSWGIELINLEVNDIRDDATKESNVISDYESIRKAQINSKARQEVSIRDREAVEIEQDNRQKAEISKAVAEELFTKRQIEKDKNIGIMAQDKEKEIARQEEEANRQKVEALRTKEVGEADVIKQATIAQATGEAEAIRVRGEKEANVIQLKGEAEGRAIQAKGQAEAVAKEKMAEAMQRFNDAATNIEKIRAWIEVQKSKWEAYGKVASNADIKIVSSGKGASLLGVPMNAETGADFSQMMDSIGDIDKISKAVKSVTKKLKNDDKTPPPSHNQHN
jgi:flotillin